MFNEVDLDGNDEIDFLEFLALIAKKNKDIDTDEELNSGFKLFDADGDNVISYDDLKNLMEDLGENLTEQEL